MYKLNIFNRIALGLAIALVLTSGFVPNIQAEESNPFTDLSVSDENYEAIIYLEDNGVIGGYPDGTFKPDDTVNRAELLKILVGGTGVTPTVETYSDCFPDVTTDWYAPYVCYAKSEGWVDGYPDSTFKPEDEVNKVEAIKMLVNSQGYSVSGGVSEPPFDDVATTDWFAPYVEVAKDKGLLEETGGSFGVAAEMKRGGVSENIYRAMIIEDYGLTSFSSYSLTSTTVGEDDPVSTPSRVWTVNEIEIVDDPYQLYTDVETDKLVGINFTNQNISDETLTFADVSFVIKASDGSEYAPILVSPKTPELTGGTLDPDEKRTGWVTFEVPAELTEADLVFLVTLEDGAVERIKKPITIPEVESVTVDEDDSEEEVEDFDLQTISASEYWKSWDSDGEDDGFELSVYFKNDNNELIYPVEPQEWTFHVKIYVTEWGDSFNHIKGELLYEEEFTGDDVRYSQYLNLPYVRINKEDIEEVEDAYGYLELTIESAEYGSFSAIDDFVKIYED